MGAHFFLLQPEHLRQALSCFLPMPVPATVVLDASAQGLCVLNDSVEDGHGCFVIRLQGTSARGSGHAQCSFAAPVTACSFNPRQQAAEFTAHGLDTHPVPSVPAHIAPGQGRRAAAMGPPSAAQGPLKERVLLLHVDGLGDVTIPAFGDRTPLEVAHVPFLDAIAGEGRGKWAAQGLACVLLPQTASLPFNSILP